MISIRKAFLSLGLAASMAFGASCADVEGDPSEADELADLADEQPEIASTEQALNPIYTITFPQNWGLRAEGAAPPRNDFRLVPYCTTQTCRYQAGYTVRVTLGGPYSTWITCGNAAGQRLSGSYVYIYNLNSDWNCTRAY